jgi:hypothetical protein
MKESPTRPTPRDLGATSLLGALVVIYVAYLAFGGLPLVGDASDMASLGLVVGFASRWVAGRSGFHHDHAFLAGLAVMAIGVVAHASGSELVLAVFIVGNVAAWAIAMPAGTGRDDARGAEQELAR